MNKHQYAAEGQGWQVRYTDLRLPRIRVQGCPMLQYSYCVFWISFKHREKKERDKGHSNKEMTSWCTFKVWRRIMTLAATLNVWVETFKRLRADVLVLYNTPRFLPGSSK